MVPPAPGRVSTTTGCFQSSVSCSARMRATVSAEPPAEKPETIFTVRDGKSCAAAASAKAAAIAAIRARIMSSIGADVRRANDLAPQLGLLLDIGREFLGRGGRHFRGELREPLLHLRRLHHL